MISIPRTDADVKAIRSIVYDPAELDDDGFDWLNIRVEKPWGHEIQCYRDKHCAIWKLKIMAGKQTSLHCHPSKVTLLSVFHGNAILETLGMSYPMKAGDVAIIEKGAFHRTKARSGTALLYEIEWPNSKRDLVRLHDSYGRGQGYEKVCANTTR